MKLADLIPELKDKTIVSQEVINLSTDSRDVTNGSLFFALSGSITDGHRFVGDALAKGAIAAVVAKPVGSIEKNKLIIVPDVHQSLLSAVSYFYQEPWKDMLLIGISGTNGKTSTSFLIHSILQASDLKSGLIGTTGYRIQNQKFSISHTTPDPITLAKIFAQMKENSVKGVVMEVSSHALDQRRVHALRFDVAVFTNLSRDHLDYHKDIKDYRKAKTILYEELLKPDGYAIINLDDPESTWIASHSRGKVITYGSSQTAQIRLLDTEIDEEGSWFKLSSPWGEFQIHLHLAGRFNIYNAMAAFGAGMVSGLTPHIVLKGLESVDGIPGRFERIDWGQDFGVVVDYAHTPDALDNLLHSAREVCAERLIVVFGCGGDRDKGKRPLMGEIVSNIADFAIITSDNPRTEDSTAIMREIEVGLLVKKASHKDKNYYRIEPDRRMAIILALEKARNGDFVIIAGKGHEDYQIIGQRKIHFSDREEVENWLRKQGYNAI